MSKVAGTVGTACPFREKIFRGGRALYSSDVALRAKNAPVLLAAMMALYPHVVTPSGVSPASSGSRSACAVSLAVIKTQAG